MEDFAIDLFFAALIPGLAEIVLIAVLILVLFGINKPSELWRGFKAGWSEFKRTSGELRSDMEDSSEMARAARQAPERHSLAVWFAQGFGLGQIPKAPGTFGSVAGVLWFLLLLLPGSLRIFIDGLVLGVILSVWLCGRAEKALGQVDPPSVVLDEIVAIPICFLPWVITAWMQLGTAPSPEYFFSARTWWMTILIFALFRCFDILKPWPIRPSQKLPGGWGVTIDDVLAAVAVALLTLLFVS